MIWYEISTKIVGEEETQTVLVIFIVCLSSLSIFVVSCYSVRIQLEYCKKNTIIC